MKLNIKKSSLFMLIAFLASFVVIGWGIYFDASWIVLMDDFGAQIFRLNISSEASSMIYSFARIGNISYLLLIAFIIALVLLFKKEIRNLFWFGFSMGLTGGLAPLVLKNVVRRGRPTDGLMTRSGYSFPSGHAMGSLALYGLVIMLAIIYIRKLWLRYTVMISCFAIILIISWSRIHLGFHFFSDVVGSLFLGVSLQIVVWNVYLSISNDKKKDN